MIYIIQFILYKYINVLYSHCYLSLSLSLFLSLSLYLLSATVTTLRYLVFDLHIILIKLFINIIAYGLHFKIKFEFKIIDNTLRNALKTNKKHLYFIISGSFKIPSSVNSLDVLAIYSPWVIVLIILFCNKYKHCIADWCVSPYFTTIVKIRIKQ